MWVIQATKVGLSKVGRPTLAACIDLGITTQVCIYDLESFWKSTVALKFASFLFWLELLFFMFSKNPHPKVNFYFYFSGKQGCQLPTCCNENIMKILAKLEFSYKISILFLEAHFKQNPMGFLFIVIDV
jgi:hypothetical protein